jgi:hypothetical protein
MIWTKSLAKTIIASALAGGFLLFSGAGAVRAADFESCRRNVDKWESRLDHDIHYHGVYSRQANHDRHELTEARERCERQYGNAWR